MVKLLIVYANFSDGTPKGWTDQLKKPSSEGRKKSKELGKWKML